MDISEQLGAREVLSRTTLELGTRPLEKARWAGAIDAVGGDMLAWLTRTTDHWGGIASTGLTGGVELHTTVMPFILRGVSLIGIDSVLCPMDISTEVWQTSRDRHEAAAASDDCEGDPARGTPRRVRDAAVRKGSRPLRCERGGVNRERERENLNAP